MPTQLRPQVRVVTLKIDDQDVECPRRRIDSGGGPGKWHPHSHRCATWKASASGAPAGCAWSKSRAADRWSPPARRASPKGWRSSPNTERLQKYRRMIVELLFAERNHVCSVCVSNGHCELQDLAQECGVDHVRVPYRNARLQRRCVPRPVSSRSQSLRALHSLRARLRRNRRGSHLGRDGTRHRLPGDHRSESALGRKRLLHELRQMRPGLSDRRLGQAGTSAGEMEKDRHFLPYLSRMRGTQ